jgi:hypothetical protein
MHVGILAHPGGGLSGCRLLLHIGLIMVDLSEIRFGTVAVQKGFITPGQLGEAVGLQMKVDLEKGIHKVLTEVLVVMGFMTPSRVEELLQAR